MGPTLPMREPRRDSFSREHIGEAWAKLDCITVSEDWTGGLCPCASFSLACVSPGG